MSRPSRRKDRIDRIAVIVATGETGAAAAIAADSVRISIVASLAETGTPTAAAIAATGEIAAIADRAATSHAEIWPVHPAAGMAARAIRAKPTAARLRVNTMAAVRHRSCAGSIRACSRPCSMIPGAPIHDALTPGAPIPDRPAIRRAGMIAGTVLTGARTRAALFGMTRDLTAMIAAAAIVAPRAGMTVSTAVIRATIGSIAGDTGTIASTAALAVGRPCTMTAAVGNMPSVAVTSIATAPAARPSCAGSAT